MNFIFNPKPVSDLNAVSLNFIFNPKPVSDLNLKISAPFHLYFKVQWKIVSPWFSIHTTILY